PFVWRVVDLEKRLDLGNPALAHEGNMVGVIVVSRIGLLTGEFHGEAEAVVVLGADLFQALEFLDTRDLRQEHRVVEEGLLSLTVRGMLQPEYDRVTDHLSPFCLPTWRSW